jgi:type II secretory pathway component GspD/PulD (secretin)
MDARMEERQRQGELSGSITGQSRQQQGNNQQGGNNNNQQNNRNQAGSVNGVGTPDQPAAQLIPDDRLNRIMVVAAPTDMAYIMQLIQEFDKPLDNHNPIERKLQYVKANDILPVIVDILQDTGTGQTQLPGGRQIQSRPTPVTSSQLATLTGANQNQNNQNRTQNANAAEEIGGRADQIAFPIDEVAPISVLVGKTRIIADRQSNSIIIIGTREAEQIVLDMIERLDRKPVQVYLATVIGEMILEDDFELGVDYIQRFRPWDGNNPSRGGFTGGLFNSRTDVPQNGNIADLSNMVTTSPFGPTGGLSLYGQIGDSLDVIITALESTNKFTVLSRPVVYTQNGKRAEITSGQEVPYADSAVTDTTNPNSVRSTVDFKDVVLKLEVLPTINENNEVTLDIVQINDRVIQTTVIDQNEVPVIGKQELNTTVTVANRSTIILGGLISEEEQEGDSGIPLLKDIPIIGQAAKTTTVGTRRSELMIFIQPVVVESDQQAVNASYDEDVRTDVGEAAATQFPEPGVPTIQHQAEVVEEYTNPGADDNPFKKFGQKLFGKKKEPREPLPYNP